MSVRKMVRQGDVLLVAVDEIPSDAIEKVTDDLNRPILAYGEASGHAHMIECDEPEAIVYRGTKDGRRFVELLKQTITTNLKHGTLTPSGITDGTADHDVIALSGASALFVNDGKLQQAFQVEDFGIEVRRVAD